MATTSEHRSGFLVPAPRLLRVLLLCLAVTPAAPVWAGSLCGVVRDAATSNPIPNAGVFLREPSGAYTGLHAASNASGFFCIDFVSPGVYDLEVLVDDYRVAYVRNVLVTGQVTSVPVEIDAGRFSLRPPFPSPAGSQVTFSWFMPAAAPARLEVFDTRGRLLSAWAAGGSSLGLKSVAWDLRDQRGRRVPAGVYYVRLESEAARQVRRFVCLP